MNDYGNDNTLGNRNTLGNFDDNYSSQELVDDVFDAEHYAGLFDEISVLHRAIMDQNWPAADVPGSSPGMPA